MNTEPKRSNEPIFWALFGAGGMWSAVFAPVAVLLFGLLLPFNAGPGEAFSYERLLELARSIPGRLFLFLMVVLPLWCGIHRIHHCLHDLKFHSPLVQWLCLGFAYTLSLVALFQVIFI
jgi:fumarate reductase subunit D